MKSLDRDHRFKEKKIWGEGGREKKKERKNERQREKKKGKTKNLQKNTTLLLLGMTSVGSHTDLDGLLEEL